MQLLARDPQNGVPLYYVDGVWILCARCAAEVPAGRLDGPHRVEWVNPPDVLPRCERCGRLFI
ncbi:hypothetical protein [Sulfobacillus thermosulfidooxidans]|uniref:hypothetical protein n=1 Tax=Sulfobacillus thermosulfidooxidans TaxID=28034 RepID=UPI0002EF2838|nr:hypothetical protein [Sulfobacillus thermosulfidooxidans]